VKREQFNPKNITKLLWLYVEGKGLCVCIRHTSVFPEETAYATIPWKDVRACLKHHDKKRAKKGVSP